MTSRDEFSRRLRELRVRRKWTQEYLAEASGLAVDTVRRLEAAAFNPSLETLRKLGNGLGITTVALLSEHFDVIDDLAVFIRQLPDPQQKIAFAVVYTLHQHSLTKAPEPS